MNLVVKVERLAGGPVTYDFYATVRFNHQRRVFRVEVLIMFDTLAEAMDKVSSQCGYLTKAERSRIEDKLVVQLANLEAGV